MRNLNISSNNIGKAGAHAFGENTTLIVLNVGFNKLDDTSAGLLAGNKTIKKLHLSYNRITAIGASLLAVNSTFLELDLQGNTLIYDECAIPFLKNTTLKSLNIDCTSIDRYTQSSILEHIKRNATRDDFLYQETPLFSLMSATASSGHQLAYINKEIIADMQFDVFLEQYEDKGDK